MKARANTAAFSAGRRRTKGHGEGESRGGARRRRVDSVVGRGFLHDAMQICPSSDST